MIDTNNSTVSHPGPLITRASDHPDRLITRIV
jgi:hypothetical protein